MAETNQNDQFAPGVFFKRQSFGKGKGEIIKQNIRWDEFKEWAEANVNDAGYLNLDIKTAKSDNNRLYAELNTWVPANSEAESQEDTETEDDSEGAPF